ncbi:MAG: hypothetical protein J6N32_03085, partial [Clostridia bacterium]|nr:hypothetical protein [Clostridia bacterium]
KTGVLTGNDAYGTFSPYQNISRAELAALLCRLAKEDTRVKFTLMPKPADTVVRTTSCRLVIAGIPVYGVVEIDKKYYMPLEILDDRNILPPRVIYLEQRMNQPLSLEIHPENLSDGDTVIRQTSGTPAGIEMGHAEPYTEQFLYHKKEVKNAVYTIDGRYPMVSLDAIGAKREGNDFILYPDQADDVKLQYEDDLVGTIPSQLKRNTTRETVIAVHDYLVNTLTYDPRVSRAYTTQEQMEEVDKLWTKAEETYTYENNLSLATGYGVCQNYSEIFQSMCYRLGIPCILMSGSAGSGSHAWNMVYVDDEWRYVDCTWDDPVGMEPVLRWDYCLVGADVLVNSHAWRGKDYPMPDEYDPAWEQLDPNNITSADMFRKCLIAQMMQKKTSFSLKTTVSGAYGGTACIYYYSHDIGWCWFSGSYDYTTYTYNYEVEYWNWEDIQPTVTVSP